MTVISDQAVAETITTASLAKGKADEGREAERKKGAKDGRLFSFLVGVNGAGEARRGWEKAGRRSTSNPVTPKTEVAHPPDACPYHPGNPPACPRTN